jgi:hypothetical protein
LKELPVQERQVKLTVLWPASGAAIQGRQRQIFCQQLNEVAHPHARETKWFSEILQLLGHAIGGCPGERLNARLGISPVSGQVESAQPRVQFERLKEDAIYINIG